MRPINFDNVEEKSLGDFQQLPAGAYACQVTEVQDNEGGEYLRVLLDIVAGSHEGYFSDDFYSDKPWAHSLVMSYKDANLGYLKHNLRMFTESNTGFDAEAAFNGGKEQMLVGKVIGCVFRAEEYYDKKQDEFRVGSPRPDLLISTSAIEGYKAPEPKQLTRDQKIQALKRGGVADPGRWLARRDAASESEQSIAAEAAAVDLPF